MLLGLVLKTFGWRLKLVFNSAGPAAEDGLHQLLDRPHGRGHRDQRRVGLFRRAPFDRDPSRRRPRRLQAARRPRRRVRRNRPAGKIRDRDVRPGAQAEGQRPVRRGDVPTPAEIPRLHRRDRRPRLGRQPAVRGDAEEPHRSGRPRRAHPIPGRIADRGGAAVVSAHLDLRVRLARRGLRAHAARGDGGGETR